MTLAVPGPARGISSAPAVQVDDAALIRPGPKYQWENNLTPLKAGIAKLPGWLLPLISHGLPKAPPVSPQSIPPEHQARASMYAKAALQRELDRLAKTPKGQRNATLNDCAFKLGQFVPSGLLDPRSVAEQLSKIALEEAGIAPTIKSGLEAGQRNPRRLEFLWPAESGEATATAAPNGPNDPLTQELAQLGETDSDNAERFARRFRHQVIFTPGRGWLVSTTSDGSATTFGAWCSLPRKPLASSQTRRIT